MKSKPLAEYKVKELKTMFPDVKYTVGTSKEDYIKQIEASKKSEGLGDDIEKILNSDLLKPLTNKVKSVIWGDDNEDCGCDDRRQVLNKIFPYNKPNCMTKGQYESWIIAGKEIQETQKITPEQQTLIVTLLRDILNMSVKPCVGCSGEVWKKYIEMISKVADTYKEEK